MDEARVGRNRLRRYPQRTAVMKRQNHLLWQRWQEGLLWPITLPTQLPPLKMLLVMDNLKRVQDPGDGLVDVRARDYAAVYAPGRVVVNMAESIQRILKRRGLDCQHPQTPERDHGVVWKRRARGWNREPTSFEWGGARAASGREVVSDDTQ